jgi:CubicO group peptidase (beta-lactamase class C family)
LVEIARTLGVIYLLLLAMLFRYFKLVFVLVFCTYTVTAQEQTFVTSLVEKIKTLYNQENYHDFHALLNEEFQTKLPEKEFSSFFNDMVRKGYGNIETSKYKFTRNKSENYLMKMEKGELLLTLYLDEAQKISGMQWLPYKGEIELPLKKKGSYASDNKKSSALDIVVDSVVKDLMSGGASCGLTIGIYKEGKSNFYNYGETERGNKALPNENSIYEIGSITKTFTGIILAKALLEKKIHLKDDIRKYLPGQFPNLNYGGKPITVEHLANHTSRIPSIPPDISKQKEFDELNPYKNYTKEMMFAYLKTFIPDMMPGSKNEYSNMGMALLGIILEKVYEKDYSQLVSELIAAPNEMKHTKVKLDADDLKLKCKGYDQNGKETPFWELNSFAAAGAINSSGSDLLKYAVANMQEKDEAMRLSHELTFGDVNYGIALGWHIIKTKKGNKMIWHNGGTYGFSSFAGFIKEKDCAIVVLSNSGSNTDAIAIQLMSYLQD